MKTINWSTTLTPNEYRIRILELAEKYGEHDVLSMILRGMTIAELEDNLDYLIKEFASWSLQIGERLTPPLSVAISYQITITNHHLIVTATFRITTSYGMIRCYPVNATAKLLCDLSGFKTLTTDSLSIIEDLGYTCLNTINDSLITRNSLI